MSILILRILCAYFICVWFTLSLIVFCNYIAKRKNSLVIMLFAPFLVLTKKGRLKINNILKGK